MNLRSVQYVDTTTYNKLAEDLAQQSLSITLEMTEAWGTLRVSGSASHYLHDMDLAKGIIDHYQYGVTGQVSLRLFRGLSLSILGSASKLHNNQLSLLKKQFTPEEILLGVGQLGTSYSTFTNISLSYTFGSIYSNVVNPRFGY
ncbi:hypothetical protein ACFLZR_00610 [Candidatus Neomarinimicrobiota bacterium]